ncbi:MAG: flagellar hook-basal body complex protein [Bryobacteraceae bacterium]
MGSFDIALSALQAFSTAIDAVGNNLANMSTTGFKASDVNFEDVMGNVTANNSQIGNGVQQPYTETDFSQGTFTTTTNPLDAAIDGNGFFLLAPAGSTGTPSPSSYQYTRDGSFQVGADGTLQTANGENVQGWSMNPSTGQVNTSGPVGNITIPEGTIIPGVATSTLSISANLNASAASGATLSVPITVYDSEGGAHQLTLTMTKDATTPNQWDLTLSSTDPSITNGSSLTSLLSVTSLTFANGELSSSTPAAISIKGLTYTSASGIPAQPTISWSPWTTAPSGTPATGGVSGLTQFSQTSAVTSVTQNGLSAGTLTSVQIANGGEIIGTYSNGAQQEIGQLAVAGVQNPNSLTSIGNNDFAATASTVALPPSVAGAGGTGQILGESLESSNVDMATEFTNLINFQSGYSAASRVVTTQDQLIQQLLQVIQP